MKVLINTSYLLFLAVLSYKIRSLSVFRLNCLKTINAEGIFKCIFYNCILEHLKLFKESQENLQLKTY